MIKKINPTLMFQEGKGRGPEFAEPTPEKPLIKLERLMGQISQEINAKLDRSLIDSQGTIDMRAWAQARGGKALDELSRDEEWIREKELEFSGLNDPKVQAFYRDEYKAQTQEEMLAKYREQHQKQKGIQFEKAKTALFHKFMKGQFIVVRTSAHDDFRNKVDNLMINLETGGAVCALDEVRTQKEDTRAQEKIEYIKDKAQKGGMTIKYGFTFEDKGQGKKELSLKELKNVPIFCLALDSEDVDKLLEGIGDINALPSQIEKEIFQKLVASLSDQMKILDKGRADPLVRYNLRDFKAKSLPAMEKRAKE